MIGQIYGTNTRIIRVTSSEPHNERKGSETKQQEKAISNQSKEYTLENVKSELLKKNFENKEIYTLLTAAALFLNVEKRTITIEAGNFTICRLTTGRCRNIFDELAQRASVNFMFVSKCLHTDKQNSYLLDNKGFIRKMI